MITVTFHSYEQPDMGVLVYDGEFHYTQPWIARVLEERDGTTPEEFMRSLAKVYSNPYLYASQALTANANPCHGDRGKFCGATVGKAEHLHAEAVEQEVAAAVGGERAHLEGGKYAPRDVKLAGHAVEVKSLLKGTADRLTVHPDSLVRKADHVANTDEKVFHTVAVDERATFADGAHAAEYSGHRLYYKRGSGRYSLSQMHRVIDADELRRLVNAADADLPEKARGALPSGEELAALRKVAEGAHAARLAKDRRRRGVKEAE